MSGISTGIPDSWKLPLFWATVDGSQAGNLTENLAALLVGQMFTTGGAAGTATLNDPVPIASVAQAQQLFGVGSMLARMVATFFNGNANQLLYAQPIAEPSAGVAAGGSITVATAATAAGVLVVYLAGQKVAITVNATDTAANIATNLVAAIAAIPELPVTAAVDGTTPSKVNLTCKWKGQTGNDITIIPNYLGVNGGEAFPTGLTLTVVAMASGAGVPDFTGAISAIQAQAFDFVALPFTDTASMAAWATEYGFGPTGRWAFQRQQYGMIFQATRDTYSNLITWGMAQNSPVLSTMAVETDSPTPVWEWTAMYCARGSQAFSDDPALPLHTLEFPGILPARLKNRFSQPQINNLTNSGLAIQAVAPSGSPMIMRETTQYQRNSFGQGDTAFGLLTVLATLAELLRRMKSAVTSKYARVKLVPDNTRLGPGQKAVRPIDVKAELIAEARSAEFDGLMANIDAFKANLIVQISPTNPNVLQVLWAPQLAGQLRQFDVLAQFRLLYPPIALT